MVSLLHVGFWSDEHLDTALPHPREFIDPAWSSQERAIVANYLRNGQEHASYRGFSYCRFHCGKPSTQMGSRDLTDGVYVWPQGFVHYIEDHNVKPPQEFISHVLAHATTR